MPKRSEKRDTAKAEYIAKKKKGEEVSLRALAGELGVSYQTLRNWKAADKWEEALPKKKRGGQPGNQNSKGKRNAAGSHDGAPPGNKNAEKDGAYSTVFFDKLRVHVSTIYRELKRGAYDRLDGGTWEVKTAYSPDIAEEKYQAHLREKGPDLKIGNDHELANYIETTILDKDCSPAAVLGFAMIEGKKFKTSLSVPTIYKYIAKGLFLNLTQEELPRHGKKKHKYKKVKKNKSASRAPAGESIEQRPEEIDEREEFGHWEGDTVYSGKGKRKTTRALLTLTERKTRKEIIIAIPNRKAETVVKALDALERKLGARRFRAIFKSITFDNGTEFAAAEELERSCINKHLPRTKVYFCHPYSSWERGTNENTNGMIRRRFPKGTNFAAVTNAQIVQAENWINNYPRKILGYKSSEIVFRECLRELGIAA